MDEEKVGNGDVDLRWSSLLTVCQRRRRGLVEDEETMVEWNFFLVLARRIRLW